MVWLKLTQLLWQITRGRVLNQHKTSEALVQALSQMPGLPRKLAQNLVPKRGREIEFKNSIVPLWIVKNKIQSKRPLLFEQIVEWGEDPQVASLGQVNRVRLQDGSELAIKTLLPGIQQDLKSQTSLMLKTFSGLKWIKTMDFDTDSFALFLEEQLAREVNFSLELKSQQQMKKIFAQNADVYVPEVYEQWSDDEMLVQEFVYSIGMSELEAARTDHRQRVAAQLGRALRVMLFEVGFLHGDLHAKNWGWSTKHKKIILYDFGSMLQFTSNQQEALVQLLNLVEIPSSDQAYLDAWRELGFSEERLRQIKGKLPQLSKIFMTIFTQPPPWHIQEQLEELLGEEKWIFRQAGPPWFMWVMRTLSSVLASIEQLQGVETIVEENKVEKKMKKKLLICVHEGKEEMVRVELPVHSIENLADLVPNDVRIKISQSGIDLAALAEDFKRRDYPMEKVFEQQNGDKCYMVSIVQET